MLGHLPKDYRRRLTASAITALVIHSAAILAIGALSVTDRESRIGLTPVQEPVTLNLQPPDMPRRLVETTVPADEPVESDTDLISDQDARASDPLDMEGDRPAPFFEEPADFDGPGGDAPTTMPDQPAPAPEPEPEPTAGPEPEPEAPPIPVSETEAVRAEPEVAQESTPEESHEPADAAPERREMARLEQEEAPMPPLPEADRPRQPRGRIDGGVRGPGILGFEAKQDELAPYLLHIRRKVEARWHTAIQMNYSGTAATRAVLDCVIAPDGRLVSVTVVDAGDSPTYAALCREAIERSAPFDPFPFDVPEIYENRNIEIRWTFSFFM